MTVTKIEDLPNSLLPTSQVGLVCGCYRDDNMYLLGMDVEFKTYSR